ncbi:MAG TPA: hypothetical protein VID24_04325 [Candidatus Eremiobacteraceae bacterium]|jgi:hypothetical protein
MTNKALAFVIIVSFIAATFASALPAGAAAASHPAVQSLSTSTCTTNDLNDIVAVYGFDSPTYKSAAPTVPQGVKSYLSRLLTTRLGSCASQAGASAMKACSPGTRETDPRALWQQLKFCVGVVALEHPAKPDPLMIAQEPTLYVLLSIGGGSGGGSGGTSPAKGPTSSASGRSGSGPATGTTATGSAVDNPADFLLFLTAQRLERDICSRVGISAKTCDAQHPVAVVPESNWTLEDLQTQCSGDPYVANDPNNPYGANTSGAPAGHGTIGAIVLNGSTVTADGTFAVFTVYGSSEANYTAQVLGCQSGSPPYLSEIWSDNISNGNKTTALSFFPFALAGTLIAANSAARSAAAPAPGPSSAPGQLSSFISYQTDIALGTFAANSSGLALGNPSSGLTFRHTFEAWAQSLSDNLAIYCRAQSMQSVCKALKIGPAQ